ncbi:P-loop containing nucleoside triphosphate hydrolase protein [Xylariaceae sp. FL0255]|nr:P-loop containing nucleoside triphosphate hydrolase protein [Xylariaceae sp. FL0255]
MTAPRDEAEPLNLFLPAPSFAEALDALGPADELKFDPETVEPIRPTGQVLTSEEPEPAIQTLYEGPPRCSCCINWVEEYPDNLKKDVESLPGTKKKALVARLKRRHSQGSPLELHSIVIQSPSLKKTLGKLFENYKGITTSLQKLVFEAPFHPFYHRWTKFKDIIKDQTQNDQQSAIYSQLLFNFLEAELRDVMAEIQDLRDNAVVTFPHLWALFEPGTTVIAKIDKRDRFFIVDSYSFADKHFVIIAKFIDYRKGEFGYATTQLGVHKFQGTMPITGSRVYPSSFCTYEEEAEEKARKRGELFLSLCGFHYKAYSGVVEYGAGQQLGMWGIEERTKRYIDGRIVIDSESYYNERPNDDFPLLPLDSGDTHSIGTSKSTSGESGNASQDEGGDKSVRRITSSPNSENTKRSLTEEQLIFCSAGVYGYSLKEKLWAVFDIESVSDIKWNDSAFPNLMIPPGYKKLVLAFVENLTHVNTRFDDFVEGKGLGLIMLLVGSPGVGKTLTAEAVADKIKKPLYILSVGELGQEAKTVERRLAEALKLAAKWDAVLLLDECDIFLQERSVHHLAHNEIVTVFLQLLEYYRGIMFMTTNRSQVIDPAFQSRIHLTLKYPELEAKAKEHIWRHFISQAEQNHAVTAQEYSRLGQLPLNGREIKNIVKMASLLAKQDDQDLNVEQIRVVLETTGRIIPEDLALQLPSRKGFGSWWERLAFWSSPR